MITIVKSVWTFIRSPFGLRLAAGIALVLVLWGMGAMLRESGVKSERHRWEVKQAAADLKEKARIAAVEKASADINEKLKVALSTERVRVQTVTKTLIKEVPTYVTAAADTHCVVPVGFVWQHDKAAAGETSLPQPPGGDVNADSHLRLSAVLNTVTLNYGAYYALRAEAQAWRDWYTEQKALWDKP